jgi:hypothetical protein
MLFVTDKHRVSMIVMQSPQFAAQNDHGQGDGIAPISQWLEAARPSKGTSLPLFDAPKLDPTVNDILCRLRILLHKPACLHLSTTDFHDLICFALHRLLNLTFSSTLHNDSTTTLVSESVRYATALYLLIVHGPAYFSHVGLQYTLTLQLKSHLEDCLDTILRNNGSLAIWLLSVGNVASNGTPDYPWFTAQAREAASALGLHSWESISSRLEEILWMEKQQAETNFRQNWECVWTATET